MTILDKNIIVNLEHRWSPKGSIKTFHESLKLVLNKTTTSNKNIVLIGDFTLNLLGFYRRNSVKICVTELFKNNLLILISKLILVTSKSISVIEHINTTFLKNPSFKSGITKKHLSDHFNIFIFCERYKKFFKNTEY